MKETCVFSLLRKRDPVCDGEKNKFSGEKNNFSGEKNKFSGDKTCIWSCFSDISLLQDRDGVACTNISVDLSIFEGITSPKRTTGEREERVGDKKIDSTPINLKTTSENLRSTSNQSRKPCTVLQHPSRKTFFEGITSPKRITDQENRYNKRSQKDGREGRQYLRESFVFLRVSRPLKG